MVPPRDGIEASESLLEVGRGVLHGVRRAGVRRLVVLGGAGILVDVSRWRHVRSVNVESVLWLSQAFTPGMAERGFGRLILITSDTVWMPPDPVLLPYITSKAAQLGMMRVLARTLGPSGISVTAVAPGLTDTPGSRTVNSDEQFEAVVAQQALARRLVREDTAAAVTFLASDDAAAMTGQVLCVDGGLVMR
ncbi:SDR family oxidoreductase [Streptomyces sp. NPDC050704]|uniref:SDR family NAD(P)-dependent oxidoreductase n=1 Tax=Streptomyces sp. NPDC050704 TaxID=3157219 RepID=UPI00341B0478